LLAYIGVLTPLDYMSNMAGVLYEAGTYHSSAPGFIPVFWWVRVAHLFSFLCCVFSIVCLRSVSCEPSVVSVSGLSMYYLRYFYLFTYSGVQHILCCIFVLFFFVLCTLCCHFLWIVHFWLPLRDYLAFVQTFLEVHLAFLHLRFVSPDVFHLQLLFALYCQCRLLIRIIFHIRSCHFHIDMSVSCINNKNLFMYTIHYRISTLKFNK
jgi:hypothetical protein